MATGTLEGTARAGRTPAEGPPWGADGHGAPWPGEAEGSALCPARGATIAPAAVTVRGEADEPHPEVWLG